MTFSSSFCSCSTLRGPASALYGRAGAAKASAASEGAVTVDSTTFYECTSSSLYHSSIVWLEEVVSVSFGPGTHFQRCTSSMATAYINGTGMTEVLMDASFLDNTACSPLAHGWSLLVADHVGKVSVASTTSWSHTQQANTSAAPAVVSQGQPPGQLLSITMPPDGWWNGNPFDAQCQVRASAPLHPPLTAESHMLTLESCISASQALRCIHWEACAYSGRAQLLSDYKAALEAKPRG